MRTIGTKVNGCAQADASCIVRVAKTALPSTKYTIVAIGITSDQGTGISKDYYAITPVK